MKKNLLKMLLVAFAMIAGSVSSWATDPDLSNYTLIKSAEFGTADAVNIACSGACAYTAYDTGNKKQQALTIATAPEDAAGWIAFQGWTDGSGKGWWNRSGQSLYCVNAQRSAAVFGDDLTTGWLVVFDCKGQASAGLTLTNADGNPDGTFSYITSEDGKSYYCTITAETNAYVGFCGIKNSQGILKISVYKPNNPVVSTTYTVNYTDLEGTQLKESKVYDAIAGSAITLTDADKANIVVGENTYVYDSDDSEGKTVAEDGSSAVTVKFHMAKNFKYTINEMANGTAVRTTEGISYETASVTAPYRKYNALDGQLYKKDASNKEYNYSFTLTEDNQVENLDYTIVENVNNVVFITEGEDVAGLTVCTSPNTAIRSSNSSSAYASEDTKIVKLSAGTYKLHAIIYDASKNPDSHWIFKAGETQIADFNCTTVNIQEFDSEEFTLAEDADIIFAAAGNNNMGLDALYIVGNGQVVEEPVLATEAVFDFNASNHPTSNNGNEGDITEDEVLIDGDVTLTISPAEEGKTTPNRYWSTNKGPQLRMYSGMLTLEAGTKAIVKVVINQGKWNAENTFNGVTAATSEWEGNSTNVVLDIAGNTQMNSIVVTLAERDGDTTTFDVTTVGISNIAASQTAENAIYNLQGQRVEQTVKGLYIVNGKKVLVK